MWYSFFDFVCRDGSRVVGLRGVDWRSRVIQCFNQREGRRRRKRERREGKEDLRRGSRSPDLDSCVASWTNFAVFFIALGFCSATWILSSASKYCCYHTLIVRVLFVFFPPAFFQLFLGGIFFSCLSFWVLNRNFHNRFFPLLYTPCIRQLFLYSLKILKYTYPHTHNQRAVPRTHTLTHPHTLTHTRITSAFTPKPGPA